MKPVLKKSILNSLYHWLQQSEPGSSSAWCPGPLCCASLLLTEALCTPTQSHQLPPPPRHSPCGGPSAVGVLLMQLLWPQPQLATPWHREGAAQSWSFPHTLFLPLHPTDTKEERGPKDGGWERLETKVGWIFPDSCQIYSTLLTLRRTGLSHIPSALWLGFWFWLKITTT